MKPNKRLWELHPSTICKVVGMALPLEDLQRIARKFGICGNDRLPDDDFGLHAAMVRMCNGDNPVARHTEKLIEQRFLIYGKGMSLGVLARTTREGLWWSV